MKYLILLAALLIVGCVGDNTPAEPEIPISAPMMGISAVGSIWIDTEGEEGENLCGGDFIIRAHILSPPPAGGYSWATLWIKGVGCFGTKILPAEYGNATKYDGAYFKTPVYNRRDLMVYPDTYHLFCSYTSFGLSGSLGPTSFYYVCDTTDEIPFISCEGGGGGHEDPIQD